MGRMIMIASGKGGVGKSTLASSLAVSLARRGMRCLLLDADVGLRNLDLMMGVQDRVLYELSDCLCRRCSLDEAVVVHGSYPLLHLMMAGQEAKPKDFNQKDLTRIAKTLKNRYDMILVDAPAGIGRGVKNFISHCDQFILAATPDDVCLRDTEKMARIIMEATGKHPYLVINRYDRRLVRRGVIADPKNTAQALDLPLLGVIEQSESVYRAMLAGKTIPEGADAPVVHALESVCDRLLGVPLTKKNWLHKFFGKEGMPL